MLLPLAFIVVDGATRKSFSYHIFFVRCFLIRSFHVRSFLDRLILDWSILFRSSLDRSLLFRSFLDRSILFRSFLDRSLLFRSYLARSFLVMPFLVRSFLVCCFLGLFLLGVFSLGLFMLGIFSLRWLKIVLPTVLWRDQGLETFSSTNWSWIAKSEMSEIICVEKREEIWKSPKTEFSENASNCSVTSIFVLFLHRSSKLGPGSKMWNDGDEISFQWSIL